MLAGLDDALAANAFGIIDVSDSSAVLAVRGVGHEGVVGNATTARFLISLGIDAIPTVRITGNTTGKSTSRARTSSSLLMTRGKATLLRGSRSASIREATAFAVTFGVGGETVAGRRMEVTGRGVGRVPVSTPKSAVVIRGASGGSVIGEGTSLLVVAAVDEVSDEGNNCVGTDQHGSSLAWRVGLDKVGDNGDAKTDIKVTNHQRLAVLRDRAQFQINIQTSADINHRTCNLGLTSLDNIVPTSKARGIGGSGGDSQREEGGKLHLAI